MVLRIGRLNVLSVVRRAPALLLLHVLLNGGVDGDEEDEYGGSSEEEGLWEIIEGSLLTVHTLVIAGFRPSSEHGAWRCGGDGDHP